MTEYLSKVLLSTVVPEIQTCKGGCDVITPLSFIISIDSNLKSGLILSGNFDGFKEILFQVNKAVLALSYCENNR